MLRHPCARITARLSCAALAMLCGCRHKSEAPEGGSGSVSPNGGTPTGGAASSGAASASQPKLVWGTRDALRTYLQTVDTVRGATFDVTWAPETVRLSRDVVVRTLLGASDDGSTFGFDASEPQLKSIHPGSILLIWGVALRRVSRAETHNDTLYVQTDPVALSDAISRGTIAWNMPPSLDGGMFVHQVIPRDSAAPTQHGFAPRADAQLFRLASAVRGGQGGAPPQGQQPGSGSPVPPGGGLPNAPELTPPWLNNGVLWGLLGSYVWRMEVHPNGKIFDIVLDIFRTDWSPQSGSDNASRGRQGAIGASQDSMTVYKMKPLRVGPSQNGDSLPMQDIRASDLMDMRVHVDGHLTYNGGSAKMTYTGTPSGFGASLYNKISGYANMRVQARLGETGMFAQKFKLQLPVSYNIPFIVGGLPFMVQISGAFIVRPALTTHHTVFTGSVYAKFDGSSGFHAGLDRLNPDGTVTGETQINFEPSSLNNIVGVGVSALQVSAQVPRFGLGLGLLNTGVLGYTDLVHTLSIMSEGQLGIAPCREAKMMSVWSVGVSAQLWGPLGIGQKMPLDTMWWSQKVFPDLKICKVL